MIEHLKTSEQQIRALIKNQHIQYGGNRNLKIYGTLQCKSGKRMYRKNRVFFTSENEALTQGYRPCGHCMKAAYKIWKNGLIQ
ncbi:Ada metal-binding domain-containing protein [Flavobacterium litorale]|uniref:Metal-binding protein n=1 Tax=Flavobacterium litorale TaxID=2856519 RepID=A0ABX8V9A5_9FLAO|nr:Ada metal-binding domain-containing protein [Flavobacterium litorale]QYJ69438.1 metal-binding protein [Flavobacterium litorale]